MKILFYRYGSICEPDLIEAFRSLGLEVMEETAEITDKGLTSAERVRLLQASLEEAKPLFVFSINFYPVIAEICHIYKILYLCWTVDSPVPELFSSALSYDTNRIFLFDRAQYTRFAPYNPNNIFHLPLYSSVNRFDKVLQTISPGERQAYGKDISFIGSLYSEKNPLKELFPRLPAHTRGYIQALINASLKIYGYHFIEDTLTDELVNTLKNRATDFYTPGEAVANPDKYIAAHSYIGMQLAETERIQTLNTLAEYFSVDLYTYSDTSPLRNVNVHGGIASLTEMPKLFHLSKINLNMTIRPIQEGLPLRIFDILGCGGFLMTNYQGELNDYFEIGTDLEAYSGLEELVDKCAYYLEHETLRQKIAQNGYEKVCAAHTCYHRIGRMLASVLPPEP
ncbi:MAG: glycosyltransferase [Roseburia sp.]|nr:glycosyltransferase [Roseburia sp.]